MDLISVVHKIILEQAGQNTIELPNDNVVVSLFPEDMKILFTPQDHKAFTRRIRLYVKELKKKFDISNIRYLSKGAFEIEFDPRESFEEVKNFISQLSSM